MIYEEVIQILAKQLKKDIKQSTEIAQQTIR